MSDEPWKFFVNTAYMLSCMAFVHKFVHKGFQWNDQELRPQGLFFKGLGFGVPYIRGFTVVCLWASVDVVRNHSVSLIL